MSDNNSGGEDQKQNKHPEEEQKNEDDKTSQTVYVGSLAWATNEDGLRAAFEKYGNITAVRIPHDDRDRSKGFGFVEFETAEEAEKALEMDGQELDGREIKVSISRKARNDHPRERRGGYHHDNRHNDHYDNRRGGDRRGGNRYNDRRSRY